MRLPLLPRELHQSDRPSSTAQWTTLGRALELTRPAHERIVSDPFAPYFLSDSSARVLSALTSGGAARRVVERSRLASIATSSLCRHRFIDAHLLEALPDAEQVVLLGAGYDSRAYRFRGSIGSRRVFEVDLPPISRRKAAIVAARPDIFGSSPVERVEIDFRTQSLRDRLTSAGFRPGRLTVVVWEGVAMYLTREAVTDTVASLAALCGPGSVLLMDCWQHVGGWTPYDQVRRLGERAIRLVGEPIGFAVPPQGLADVLDRPGFRTADVATSDVLARRYATAGRRCDEGLYVVAAVR